MARHKKVVFDFLDKLEEIDRDLCPECGAMDDEECSCVGEDGNLRDSLEVGGMNVYPSYDEENDDWGQDPL